MGKEVATVNFDFDVEVVETKALVDEWKGAALTWWSVDGKLCSKLFKAYEALGGGEGPGKYQSKVQGTTSKSKVQSCTLKDFYEGIGMKKRTFYNFINRTKQLLEAGADLENMSGNVKIIADMTGKTEKEIELEEKLVKLEDEITGRDEAIDEYEKAFKEWEENATDLENQIATLKAKLEGGENPELIARIEKLEKKEALLAQKINWTGTAATFKKRLQSFRKKTSEISELAETLFESVPKETKNN